jgi:hypothetical protein
LPFPLHFKYFDNEKKDLLRKDAIFRKNAIFFICNFINSKVMRKAPPPSCIATHGKNPYLQTLCNVPECH